MLSSRLPPFDTMSHSSRTTEPVSFQPTSCALKPYDSLSVWLTSQSMPGRPVGGTYFSGVP